VAGRERRACTKMLLARVTDSFIVAYWELIKLSVSCSLVLAKDRLFTQLIAAQRPITVATSGC
jgi:hypothetical protein